MGRVALDVQEAQRSFGAARGALGTDNLKSFPGRKAAGSETLISEQ